MLKEAWVLVRRRNSRLRFSNVFVVRSDFHIALGEGVERQELEAGFFQRRRDRRTQRRPLLHEGVVGGAGGQAVGRVDDPVVVALHLGLRMARAVRQEILQLMGRAPLDADAVPARQGVLQPGVAVDDDQPWGGESALLEIGDRGTPRGGSFGCRQPQRE